MTPMLIPTGNRSYRDPACYYHNGIYHLFYTLSELDGDYMYNRIALRRSRDLMQWSEEQILTPRDRNFNYCSPGNCLQTEDGFVLCFCSYPMPEPWKLRSYAEESARLYIMRSKDLIRFSEPELIKVKGEACAESDMGRMIDPYIFEDRSEKGKYWIFYKQNGVSMSYSYDLRQWTFAGNTEAGENACILQNGEEYILFHAPQNGIGVKRSPDLLHWQDEGLLEVGQEKMPWADGRLTAGFVMKKPEGDGYLLFFHGSRKECEPETHGCAAIGVMQSTDLVHWSPITGEQ